MLSIIILQTFSLKLKPKPGFTVHWVEPEPGSSHWTWSNPLGAPSRSPRARVREPSDLHRTIHTRDCPEPLDQDPTVRAPSSAFITRSHLSRWIKIQRSTVAWTFGGTFGPRNSEAIVAVRFHLTVHVAQAWGALPNVSFDRDRPF